MILQTPFFGMVLRAEEIIFFAGRHDSATWGLFNRVL